MQKPQGNGGNLAACHAMKGAKGHTAKKMTLQVGHIEYYSAIVTILYLPWIDPPFWGVRGEGVVHGLLGVWVWVWGWWEWVWVCASHHTLHAWMSTILVPLPFHWYGRPRHHT